MADDPMVKVQLTGAEVTFMLGAEDDSTTVENVDVEVALADGSRWSATILSLAEVGRVMDRWKATGEALNGRYFRCPDLVIVDGCGIEAYAELLGALVSSGEFRDVLTRVDIEE